MDYGSPRRSATGHGPWLGRIMKIVAGLLTSGQVKHERPFSQGLEQIIVKVVGGMVYRGRRGC